MSREQRKLDHIKYALGLGDGPLKNGLEDVHFVHNCLPELAPADIDITTTLGGIKLSVPFLINAITGGTPAVTEINRQLATIASAVGAAVAVGSQYGSVKKNVNYESFQIVRTVYPTGVILANMSALATPEEACKAVDMLEANALQIHLNSAQELVMLEGDRDFRGLLNNIEGILESAKVPVIIKETGCGMAKEQIEKLRKIGCTNFDLGGAGGTNFPAIETQRGKLTSTFLEQWGLNTAQTLLEANSACNNTDTIIASGGIRNGLEATKALALGANVVGMSGNILQMMLKQDLETTVNFLQQTENVIRQIMLLTGSQNIAALNKTPLYLTGQLQEFAQCRGYSLTQLCNERKR